MVNFMLDGNNLHRELVAWKFLDRSLVQWLRIVHLLTEKGSLILLVLSHSFETLVINNLIDSESGVTIEEMCVIEYKDGKEVSYMKSFARRENLLSKGYMAISTAAFVGTITNLIVEFCN
jgi:hypothetical protein